jgi:hypothetical protein
MSRCENLLSDAQVPVLPGDLGKAVLQEHEYRSPTGKRPYDLRHTCFTTWLNNGVPAAQVAAWAGNSVPILLAIHARCIAGQTPDLLKRIEGVRDLPPIGS